MKTKNTIIKITSAFALIILLFSLSGCKEITQEEALLKAKEFVDENVKFFVSDDKTNEKQTIEKASIKVIDMKKVENEWNVVIIIESNNNNITKKSGMIVPVDSKKGEVIKEKVRPFKVEESLISS